MMGLDTSNLPDLVLAYPEMYSGYRSKQGQHDRRCWDRGHAFVAWELLVVCAEIQTDLALHDAVDQQADDREHRQGGNPFRFLQPYRADRRRVLDPAKPQFHGRVLFLVGLENL